MTRKRLLSLLFISLTILITFIVYVSYNNAKSMTQFYTDINPSPKFSEMNLMDTIDVMMRALKKKRPENQRTPKDFGFEYQTHEFQSASNHKINAWYIPSKKSEKAVTLVSFRGKL